MARVSDAGAPDPYTQSLVSGVAHHVSDIDRLLADNLSGWTLERLGILERSILRLAVFEMLWEVELPRAVAIDEAVELAKRFCSDEAGALVNGVLGSLSESHQTIDTGAER